GRGGVVRLGLQHQRFQDRFLAGFANGNGAVTGFQRNLRAAALAVISFQVRIAADGCLLQGIGRKFGVDVAGVAIGDDLEVRRFGKTEGDGRRGVSNVDVFFWGKGKTHFDVAVAIVHFHSAAGILDGNVVGIRAQREISGRVSDLEVPGAGFHMPGELREREVGALGNKAHALGDFVGANGSVEFSVDGEPAGRRGNIDFAAMPGNADVALGIRNFDVALACIHGDVAGRVVHVDVASRSVDDHGLVHVGHGYVPALIANGEQGILGNGNVQIHAGPRIAVARIHGANFIAVAVLGDFKGDAGGNMLGVGFSPGFHVLVAIDVNLRIVSGAHVNIAANVANPDAGFGRNTQR